MESVRGKKIYVGLSGGVDSAVTAALLKERGAQVTGVFIKGWYPPGMPCTWASDRLDAMRVAARLGIPFRTLDASKEYKEGVIDYLLAEYAAGRTPNPDIMCNREVKFGAFATYAFDSGTDYIATGHYARSEDGHLLRGVDPDKDQSYFLWAVPKEVLERTLFPLGELHKEKTRQLAKKFNLPNASKKDSQGICFLGSISVDDFLKKELGTEVGVAQDTEGKEVGTHQGAVLHTLGERVTLSGATPGPWYVVAKDLASNTLVVSHTRETRGTDSISLSQTNFFETVESTKRLSAQFRYHGPLLPGTLSTSTFTPVAPSSEPMAEGQSLVIYDEDLCIGGGIIG